MHTYSYSCQGEERLENVEIVLTTMGSLSSLLKMGLS
jgi:hypothetical protein